MRILAYSRRLAQPTAPRVHARVRSGVPISISISLWMDDLMVHYLAVRMECLAGAVLGRVVLFMCAWARASRRVAGVHEMKVKRCLAWEFTSPRRAAVDPDPTSAH
jgi:hypothetical protein